MIDHVSPVILLFPLCLGIISGYVILCVVELYAFIFENFEEFICELNRNVLEA